MSIPQVPEVGQIMPNLHNSYYRRSDIGRHAYEERSMIMEGLYLLGGNFLVYTIAGL
ncbi:MAG: hypothetical protein MJE63_21470 [Proteobacteria bacterium]|nr:hypothetical protein [Pseudomonadota bacterium]